MNVAEFHQNIEQVWQKIEEKLEDKLFGTIIHLIYEKIVSKNKENIEKKKLLIKSKEDEKILKKEIKDVLKDVLNSYKYKISEDYLEFYKKIYRNGGNLNV